MANRPIRTCTIEGCDAKHSARGMCKNHYERAIYAKRSDEYKARAKARYAADREAKIRYAKEWRQANLARARKSEFKSRLKRKYGITIEQYDDLYAEQGGTCAICCAPPDGEERLAVDHCHDTGAVRGLVHRTCNTAIGLLRDDPELLTRAAEYLRASQMPRDKAA